ncbi:MAG: RDD family protein [Bacteriovoracia bacterium]
MNLEKMKDQPKTPPPADDFEIDFKPITSGLGFHHQKATDLKPVVTERTVAVPSINNYAAPKKEMNVYQNDLSMFYNQAAQPSAVTEPEVKIPEEKTYRLATKPQRVFAYLMDLFFVLSLLGIVLTVMARTIHMDLMEVWTEYPNEITPLVITLFCGFYLIYFSIFEKTVQSTLGKNLFGLRVLGLDNIPLGLVPLLLRSVISLLNFISLGLFSYFDLQNKVTSAKVIRVD